MAPSSVQDPINIYGGAFVLVLITSVTSSLWLIIAYLPKKLTIKADRKDSRHIRTFLTLWRRTTAGDSRRICNITDVRSQPHLL